MPQFAVDSAIVVPRRPARPLYEWAALARTFAIVVSGTAAVLGIAVLLGHRYGVWLATLTRDPNQAAGIPFYVGLLSQFGVLLWSAAAATCLFGAAALAGNRARREEVRFLASLGAITALLMADDVFMIHDEVFPKYLGVPEEPVEAFYLLLVGAFMLRFWRGLLRPHTLLFVSALGLFGVSILIEYVPDGWFLKTHLVEDGAKLLGISNWLAYAVTVSLERVRARTR